MNNRVSLARPLIIFATLLTATLLWANDKPWNKKPYQSWDAKDLQQIMTDSPWVAKTTIRRSWRPPQGATTVQPVQQQISGGVRNDPTQLGTIRSNSGGSDSGDSDPSQVNVYVYWYSARVIRAAEARLHSEMDQTAVEKFTDEPQVEYKLVLRMNDMSPFSAKDEAFYQQNSFLQMKRSKLKLSPIKVQYERMGTTSEDVVFFFPKTAEGKPTISADETQVAFSCKVADQALRLDFKPKDMVDQFGPDL